LVSDSYTFCNIKLETTYTSTGASYPVALGGIAGSGIGIRQKISNCYSAGSVTLIDNYAGNDGKVYLGGIVGDASDGTNNLIQNCAALNSSLNISGTSGNTIHYNRICAGAISNSKLVSNVAKIDVMPDSGTITSDDDDYTSQYGKSLSEAGINQSLFEDTLNWDFENIWKWDGDLGLPVLR